MTAPTRGYVKRRTPSMPPEVLAEEVAWLRSFGFSDQRICDRLGLRLDSFRTSQYRTKP